MTRVLFHGGPKDGKTMDTPYDNHEDIEFIDLHVNVPEQFSPNGTRRFERHFYRPTNPRTFLDDGTQVLFHRGFKTKDIL